MGGMYPIRGAPPPSKKYIKYVTSKGMVRMDEVYEKFEGIITEEELESLIEEKIKNVGGLLTREGAIAIIAAEYGVDLGIEEEKKEKIKIEELHEGMNDVSVAGRVKKIYPIKTFDNGKVGNIILDDETGEIRVALWNEKTKILDTLDVGTTVEIKHGYVKEGFRDMLDLNIGKRGTIEISDISLDLPEIEKKMMRIGEIDEELRDVSVVGRVKNVFDIREFEKIDGGKGKVGNIILMDDTGEKRATFWNENTEILNKIKKNDVLLLENVYTKEGFNGYEIHAGWQTHVKINPEIAVDLPEVKEEYVKIEYVQEGTTNIKGEVKRILGVKSFEKIDGGTGKVGSMVLEDTTGEIRVVMWNEKTKMLENLSPGMSLRIENGRVKEGMEGLEVHVNNTTDVAVDIAYEKKIQNLEPGKVEMIGRVSSVEDGGFSLMDESGEIFVETEESPNEGELVKVTGELDDTLTAKEIETIEQEFPTLKELKTPERGKIGDKGMVTIRGVVKSKVEGEECCRVVLDDGQGEVSGVIFGAPEVGEEYLFKCMIKNNNKFACYDFQEVDILKEAYRLLDRVGRNG